jgi:leader peptidase (prepilin peptidase)/N-methyltransferase
MPHPAVLVIFLFALGASVGSFLNVVVWRLPRVELPPGTGLFREFWLTLRALSTPPSHCPKCNTRLSWRDNIPVLGWLLLRGKCRYCSLPISKRYPIIEFITGLLFVATYVLMFHFDLGPCAPEVAALNEYRVATSMPGGLTLARDGWLLALYLPLIACLLAASLIDAELFIIPLWIPWLMAVVGVVGHALGDQPGLPGNVLQPPAVVLMTLGGAVGLAMSLALLRAGIIKYSFADGEPMLKQERDVIASGGSLEYQGTELKDYSKGEVRREILHEVVFLLLPLTLAAVAGVLAMRWAPATTLAATLSETRYANGAVGAIFGGFIGAMWVWGTRILGSLGFGREAMGMGDVHLMLGVGAILGAGMASVAFFLAPLPGLLIHLYLVFTDPKRAVPYGPYLSFASALVIFVYCPIEAHLSGGLEGLAIVLRSIVRV